MGIVEHKSVGDREHTGTSGFRGIGSTLCACVMGVGA